MKTLYLLLLMAAICFSMGGQRIDDVLNEQRNLKIKGFLYKQQLKAPEDLFEENIIDEPKEAQEKPAEETMPTEPHPEPVSHGYVSYERYMTDMIELNKQLAHYDAQLEKMADVTAFSHRVGVSNRKFILKIVELIIYGIIGTTGIGGAFTVFRKKKRKES